MPSRIKIPGQLLPLAAALCAAFAGAAYQPAHASSHREAPFISTAPKVDGTDFYMFNSYEPGRGDWNSERYFPFSTSRIVRSART